ncbi:MAG: hypothetical protein KA105_06425 [Caulobacter sp.]|nr:hypothetical protein [Caulobacter sp.]
MTLAAFALLGQMLYPGYDPERLVLPPTSPGAWLIVTAMMTVMSLFAIVLAFLFARILLGGRGFVVLVTAGPMAILVGVDVWRRYRFDEHLHWEAPAAAFAFLAAGLVFRNLALRFRRRALIA